MDNIRREIPITDTTPIALKIKSICGVPNDQLTAQDINSFLFDDPELVENKYDLATFILNNKVEILSYLGSLSQQLVDRTARAIRTFDMDFFNTTYSGKLEIYGETYQLTDKLDRYDLQQLNNDCDCLQLYQTIQSQGDLLFKLRLAQMRIQSLSSKEVDWTEDILLEI